MLFEGFTAHDEPVDGAVIHAVAGGRGRPVLLLHGYPQTHAMWHRLAPRLAENRTVVAADLRGYGASRALAGDFTFRAMAGDQVELMSRLGFDRFDVVGHDRGARVAHRMVLDHPERVASVALLDILPTLDVWRIMDGWLARHFFHWLFLSHPSDLPSTLISRDPVLFLHAALGRPRADGHAGTLDVFAPEALAAYEEAARNPDVVRAWCLDYRAAAGPDLDHDRADSGRTSDLPVLVLWATRGVVGAQVDPLDTWLRHFPNARGQGVDAGHYLVEEQPEQVTELLLSHLR